jgi:hypothetical protein
MYMPRGSPQFYHDHRYPEMCPITQAGTGMVRSRVSTFERNQNHGQKINSAKRILACLYKS